MVLTNKAGNTIVFLLPENFMIHFTVKPEESLLLLVSLGYYLQDF